MKKNVRHRDRTQRVEGREGVRRRRRRRRRQRRARHRPPGWEWEVQVNPRPVRCSVRLDLTHHGVSERSAKGLRRNARRVNVNENVCNVEV